ncbi:hypothetical protein SARC_03507, partial [Sphaeroforma arctica JP610]
MLMRVGIYDQQPERRIPLVDSELRKSYDQTINACGDDEEDALFQISHYISELDMMRSYSGDKVNEPALSKLLKISEFPKLTRDPFFKIENCED